MQCVDFSIRQIKRQVGHARTSSSAQISNMISMMLVYHMFAAANKQEKQIWRGIASSEFLLHGSATVGAVAVQ